MKFSPVLHSVVIAGLTTLSAAAEVKSKPSRDLKEIVIEGESRIQMKGDKPDDIPKLNPQEPLLGFLTQKINLTSPADRIVANHPFLLPPKIASDIVLSPSRRHLWLPPVLYLTFKNASNRGIDHWRLMITDDQGKIFRTIKGNGQLPSHLEWDGLGDSGEPLRVGHSYSCALSVLDRVGIPTYLTSKTVRLGSYVDDRHSKITIILDTPILFVPGPSLSDKGLARLLEARDWVRKRYRGSIQVDIYDADSDLAQRQADIIRKQLETSLHLNEGAISAHGHVSDRAGYLRTEIVAK